MDRLAGVPGCHGLLTGARLAPRAGMVRRWMVGHAAPADGAKGHNRGTGLTSDSENFLEEEMAS